MVSTKEKFSLLAWITSSVSTLPQHPDNHWGKAGSEMNALISLIISSITVFLFWCVGVIIGGKEALWFVAIQTGVLFPLVVFVVDQDERAEIFVRDADAERVLSADSPTLCVVGKSTAR